MSLTADQHLPPHDLRTSSYLEAKPELAVSWRDGGSFANWPWRSPRIWSIATEVAVFIGSYLQAYQERPEKVRRIEKGELCGVQGCTPRVLAQ